MTARWNSVVVDWPRTSFVFTWGQGGGAASVSPHSTSLQGTAGHLTGEHHRSPTADTVPSITRQCTTRHHRSGYYTMRHHRQQKLSTTRHQRPTADGLMSPVVILTHRHNTTSSINASSSPSGRHLVETVHYTQRIARYSHFMCHRLQTTRLRPPAIRLVTDA